eukprot:7687634-Heterocapsa_arctica.AAC.1
MSADMFLMIASSSQRARLAKTSQRSTLKLDATRPRCKETSANIFLMIASSSGRGSRRPRRGRC